MLLWLHSLGLKVSYAYATHPQYATHQSMSHEANVDVLAVSIWVCVTKIILIRCFGLVVEEDHDMDNEIGLVRVRGVTGDIKAHQVLLNSLHEQITEDSVWYQNYY